MINAIIYLYYASEAQMEWLFKGIRSFLDAPIFTVCFERWSRNLPLEGEEDKKKALDAKPWKYQHSKVFGN